MKVHDAFGQMLYDYHVSGKSWEVIERDDGYIDVGQGPEAYFTEFGEWLNCERKAARFFKGRVLDVGCGAGRVALHLQNKGHEVVAIDVSPLAIKVCRERGVKDARKVSISKLNSRIGKFDTVVMFGNNFGIFGNARKAKAILESMHSFTSDDARILAESLDPYETTKSIHKAYHRRNRRRGRMSGQLRMRVRYLEGATPWFDMLVVSQEEMDEILDGTGWRSIRFIDEGEGLYVGVIAKS